MRPARIERWKFFGVLLCFFFSGTAGLIYQVAWSKSLGLVFGHTVYAITIVLAVFMGGLALGSAWLGRWGDRAGNAITLYGWVELGVGATGALSLLGLSGVRAVYLAFHPVAAGSPLALLGLRFVGAALVLFVPTFLMGGTLPILVRGLARTSAELGARLSRLYWVNTAGAAGGTLAAGFLLLPALGLRLTVAVAVTLNLLAGGVALWLGRSVPSGKETAQVPSVAVALPANSPRSEGEIPGTSPRFSWLLLTTFGLVGATAMGYEIAWTRLLATILGSSTYAFTLMLATFLSGIMLGSLLFERWTAGGRGVSWGTYSLTQTLTALAAVVFLICFAQLPRVVPPILVATKESFAGLVLAQFVTCALAMLPAAVVFGFNFPAVVLLLAGHAGGSRGQGAAVGRAYAANTLGAIAGATLTGFWLMRRVGSFRVVALAAGVNLLLAVILELGSRHSIPRRAMAVAANAVLLVVASAVLGTGAFYDRAMANFGTVLYWDYNDGKLTLAEHAATLDFVFAEDGLNSTITVARTDDYLSLRTNGKVDASNRDATTQLLVGHMGPLFHTAPRRVLVIGLGSGMTVSAVARYPDVERIDCVEIEPAVIRAASYLEPLNRGVLKDPRVHILLDDARNFLFTTRQLYDVVISEPSNPWIAGVATLFTSEYYRAARKRLAPGGVFVQWVQAYSLYPEDVRMILGTFVPEFPHVTLWRGDEPDLLLLGRTETGPTDAGQAPLTLARLHRLWSNNRLREDFRSISVRQPEGLLAYYLLDDAELRRLAAGALRNTDNNNRLEYRAPRALLAKHVSDKNLEIIRQYKQDLLPADLRLDDRVAALEAVADTFLNIEEKGEADRYVAALHDEKPTFALELLRGRVRLARDRNSAARLAFGAALRLDPDSLEAANGLAEVAQHLGQNETAELLYRQILARNPSDMPALEGMRHIARARRAWKEAAGWQAQRIAADPVARADEYSKLGELRMLAGESAHAEQALLKALELDPYNYAAHQHLSELYRERNQVADARHHLEFLVRFFPDSDAAPYPVLAKVYRDAGETFAAASVLRKGKRLFPKDPELARLAY